MLADLPEPRVTAERHSNEWHEQNAILRRWENAVSERKAVRSLDNQLLIDLWSEIESARDAVWEIEQKLKQAQDVLQNAGKSYAHAVSEHFGVCITKSGKEGEQKHLGTDWKKE